MKKAALTGTMVALISLSQGVPTLAATAEQANQAAESAVINRQIVNEYELQAHGSEYVTTFLRSYEQAINTYRKAYQQGLTDAIHCQYCPQSNQVVSQIAYQRGYERGQQLVDSNKHPVEETSLPLPNDESQQNIRSADSQEQEFGTTSASDGLDQRQYAHQEVTPNQARFINRIAKAAQQIGKEYDLYPSIIIAQAALESNWGSSDLGQAPYFNLFGVKGYFAGAATNQLTTEYDSNGHQYQVNDNFRRYHNDIEALRDYAQTLSAPLYEGVHRKNTTNYREATRALRGKYATDPYYDQKLNRIIDSYNLTKYDEPIKNDINNISKVTATSATIANKPIQQFSKERKKPVRHRHHYWPVLGGVGSVGVVELLRKWWLVR